MARLNGFWLAVALLLVISVCVQVVCGFSSLRREKAELRAFVSAELVRERDQVSSELWQVRSRAELSFRAGVQAALAPDTATRKAAVERVKSAVTEVRGLLESLGQRIGRGRGKDRAPGIRAARQAFDRYASHLGEALKKNGIASAGLLAGSLAQELNMFLELVEEDIRRSQQGDDDSILVRAVQAEKGVDSAAAMLLMTGAVSLVLALGVAARLARATSEAGRSRAGEEASS